MLFLLSPAKSLDHGTLAPPVEPTEPRFTLQSVEIVGRLRTRRPDEIAGLMGLSDALAALNVARYAKRARGPMAGHAIARRARTPKALESFALEGYAHDAAASQPDRRVFRRRAG